MAVALNSGSLAQAQSHTTFTMSLTHGWDKIPPEHGGRSLCAGDLIMLMVAKPAPPATPWVCTTAKYDGPIIPTFPLHHACCRIHPIVSGVSLNSCVNGVNSPSESYRPRVS